MDEEIEDIVGEVKYTDSQKSVATTNFQLPSYSPDFTDSSSPNNSFDKETYVVDLDSEDDSYPLFPLRDSKSVVNLKDRASRRFSIKSDTPLSEHSSLRSQSAVSNDNCCSTPFLCASAVSVYRDISSSGKSASPSPHAVNQESSTQTSKTIIELAVTEGAFSKPEQQTLETQTSLIFITEGKTFEYRTDVSRTKSNVHNESLGDSNVHHDVGDTVTYENLDSAFFNFICKRYSESLNNRSFKFLTETVADDNKSVTSSGGEILRITNEESAENSDEESNRTLATDPEFDSPTMSDMEEDSLMVPSNSTASNIDVHQLHEKLNQRANLSREMYCQNADYRKFGTLTPLAEEIVTDKAQKDAVLFTNHAGLTVKLLKNDGDCKLPPIQNHSWPNSPHLATLFSNKLDKLYKTGTLPCLCERSRDSMRDRWEAVGNLANPAAGENALLHHRNDSPRRNGFLPPIHAEGAAESVHKGSRRNSPRHQIPPCPVQSLADPKAICIKEKIKELKYQDRKPWANATRFHNVPKAESRSVSPSTQSAGERRRASEPAERGCEALLQELMGRLRGPNWYDVVEMLEDLPKSMARFWCVIPEQRIADLLRLVNSLVESPRTQVSRVACAAASAILSNTNYTKKPDFFETMAVLLTKTGSYSASVRRAANRALDGAVCALPHAPAIAALCLHGVGHKSGLVRCAAARLLVVAGALAAGGRALLVPRPPSAAQARAMALRALAQLLDDKSTDTRKYAERLYAMLRPLENFEAYFLTDVQVDVAARQMKKYDQLLDWGAKGAT